jgi:hypothetical protein
VEPDSNYCCLATCPDCCAPVACCAGSSWGLCCGAGGCCMPPARKAATDGSPRSFPESSTAHRKRGAAASCCYWACCERVQARIAVAFGVTVLCLVGALLVLALEAVAFHDAFLDAGVTAVRVSVATFAATVTTTLPDIATEAAKQAAGMVAALSAARAPQSMLDTADVVSRALGSADSEVKSTLQPDWSTVASAAQHFDGVSGLAFEVATAGLAASLCLSLAWAIGMCVLAQPTCWRNYARCGRGCFALCGIGVGPCVLALAGAVTAVVAAPVLLLSDACAAPASAAAALLQNGTRWLGGASLVGVARESGPPFRSLLGAFDAEFTNLVMDVGTAVTANTQAEWEFLAGTAVEAALRCSWQRDGFPHDGSLGREVSGLVASLPTPTLPSLAGNIAALSTVLALSSADLEGLREQITTYAGFSTTERQQLLVLASSLEGTLVRLQASASSGSTLWNCSTTQVAGAPTTPGGTGLAAGSAVAVGSGLLSETLRPLPDAWDAMVKGACEHALPAFAVSAALLVGACVGLLLLSGYAAFLVAFLPGVGCCVLQPAGSKGAGCCAAPFCSIACLLPCILRGRVLVLQQHYPVPSERPSSQRRSESARRGTGGNAAPREAAEPLLGDGSADAESGDGVPRASDPDAPQQALLALMEAPAGFVLDLTRHLQPMELAMVLQTHSWDCADSVEPLGAGSCCCRCCCQCSTDTPAAASRLRPAASHADALDAAAGMLSLSHRPSVRSSINGTGGVGSSGMGGQVAFRPGSYAYMVGGQRLGVLAAAPGWGINTLFAAAAGGVAHGTGGSSRRVLAPEDSDDDADDGHGLGVPVPRERSYAQSSVPAPARAHAAASASASNQRWHSPPIHTGRGGAFTPPAQPQHPAGSALQGESSSSAQLRLRQRVAAPAGASGSRRGSLLPSGTATAALAGARSPLSTGDASTHRSPARASASPARGATAAPEAAPSTQHSAGSARRLGR